MCVMQISNSKSFYLKDTRDGEQFLFLWKNNLDDEEIWFVTSLSMIQLREAILGKPGLVTTCAWELDSASAPLLLRGDKSYFSWVFEIPTTDFPFSFE
jgi:hypothetical protein